MKSATTLAALAVLIAGPLQAADNLDAFPPAEEGMKRWVLELEPQDDESNFKVELIVGRTEKLDAVNQHFFGGKIEAKNIEGWGFTRYVVESLGPLAGTLMAPPPGAPKVDRFVSLGGEPYLIRYNSRLPVVVYAPRDAEVKHRVWRADPKATAMKEG